MKRFAVPLVIGGSLTVLVALLVLLRSITSTAPAAPSATVPARERPIGAAPPTTTATPSTPASSAPAAPQAPAPSTGERMPSLPASGGESGARPAGSDDAPPGTKLNTKNLHFGLPALRDKIAGNTSQIAACAAGKRASGEILLTFIAGKRADQIEVEQTDIDGEKTTVTDQAVLDCMMAATRAIRLDGLPREAAAIMVYRSISLQDGAITDDRPTKFSYIR